ncbi:MAG: hypothetical protein WCD70_02510, partial [Alphaproteobacteria bacterium]
TQGLQMAYDPRIPASSQIFPFRVNGLKERCATTCKVTWILNDQVLATTEGESYDWPVQRGKYDLRVEVKEGNASLFNSGIIHFLVK